MWAGPPSRRVVFELASAVAKSPACTVPERPSTEQVAGVSGTNGQCRRARASGCAAWLVGQPSSHRVPPLPPLECRRGGFHSETQMLVESDAVAVALPLVEAANAPEIARCDRESLHARHERLHRLLGAARARVLDVQRISARPRSRSRARRPGRRRRAVARAGPDDSSDPDGEHDGVGDRRRGSAA